MSWKRKVFKVMKGNRKYMTFCPKTVGQLFTSFNQHFDTSGFVIQHPGRDNCQKKYNLFLYEVLASNIH